jgi:ABC-2 type transport system permease protein
VYVPREVLVAANVASWVVALLIELGVLALALLIGGNFVLPWLLLVLFLVAVQTAFVLGIALVLGVANVYFRDVQHFMGIMLQLWFYATPIVYPLDVVPKTSELLGVEVPVRFLYELNPMVRFVEAYRDCLYHLRFPPAGDLAYLVAVSALSLVAGRAVFRRLEPKLAEEL